MFIGHFGVGLAAKKIDSGVSIGTYFLASQFIDLLWPLFLILGIEKVKVDPGNTAFTPLDFVYYPFTHGFVSVLFWSLIFAAVYYLLKKNIKSALLLGLLVLSHWVLDLLTHRADLPLSWWSDFKMGFGLWNNVLLTIVVEGAIFVIGIYYYLKQTSAQNKSGHISFWSLIIFFTLIYFMNIFGPPPPSEEPIAYVGLSMWLFVGWGYWIDKVRQKRDL